MNIDIIKRFKSFHNKDQIRTIFTLLDRLIKHLGLDADDPRLALNVRNDAKKRISVNINSRLVLMLKSGKAENQLGFMIYSKDKAKLQGQFELLDLVGEEFEPRKDMDNAEIILLPANTKEDLRESVFQASLKCIEDYLPKAAKSPYRSHHLQELYEMAVAPEMLEEELEQLDISAQAVNQLNELMLKIKTRLSEEKHPLVYHKWKIGSTARFRQISAFREGDPLNKVQMHYEIRLIGKKVTVEFHQEGKPEEKREFGNLINTPAFDSFKKAPWFTAGYPENKRIFVDEYLLTDQSNIDNLAQQLSIDLKTLYNAIEPVLEKNYSINQQSSKEKTPMSLNTILYGPPGTGKTYNTINKAISIIDPAFDLNQQRKAITDKYTELVKAGQIVFTTFHQSMSYEDFIEGLKPLKPEENDDNVKYDVIPGIFKVLCENAKQIKTTNVKADWEKADFYKMSLGGKNRPDIHQWCLDNNVIVLGWGGDKDLSDYKNIKNWTEYKDAFNKAFPELLADSRFHSQAAFAFQKMKINDIVVISKGNHIIDAIGVIKGDYKWDNKNPFDYYHFRNVEWIAKDMNTLPDRFFRKKISQMSIYEFYKEDLKMDAFKQLMGSDTSKDLPYVIIIDEINRGNISQIFGELITLIEDDKRLGRPEALKITLPYSKKEFGVPQNVYIIGTMNTADRSVEALDTALRRRFTFEEKGPQTDLLKPSKLFWDLLWKYQDKKWEDPQYEKKESELLNFLGASKNVWEKRIEIWDRWENDTMNPVQSSDFSDHDFTGFRLDLMLDAINKRIEVLVDRDHQIGHAFFINVRNEPQLRLVFENKIIPLLQEYFFGDFGKIGLVLGPSFVEQVKLGNHGLFKINGFDNDLKNEYENRTYFKLTNPSKWDLKAIYEGIKPEIDTI